MTRLKRTSFAIAALLLTLPVTAAVPVPQTSPAPNASAEQAPAPTDLLQVDLPPTAAPMLQAKPASEDISEELRALMDDGELVAATKNKKKKSSKSSKKSAKSKAERASLPSSSASGAAPSTSGRSGDRTLQRARQLAAEKKYHEASRLLFQMSRSPQYQAESTQVRYILGLMLYEMKLYQTAAFVFYDVVKAESRGGGRGKYLRQALEKLSLSADALDSDVLLKYAIKKIDENDFPAVHRDMLYYRTGELKLGDKQYQDAAQLFGRVRAGSTFFSRAKYKQALALAEAGELERAQAAFEELSVMNEGVTDVNRVSGLLGKARVLYQRQNWDAALEAYREIPRDTEQWHEALFESTWAMLRSARFRSALSNFHSLHSDYYEDVYQPESLLLRSIVYLFICRHDEMEKVLGLFERVYKPVLRDVKDVLRDNADPITYYRELAKVDANDSTVRKAGRSENKIPFIVARHVLKEGDVRRSISYIARLEEEKRRIAGMPGSWSSSPVGRYAKQVVEKRIEATQQFAGKLIKRHMTVIGRELVDMFEQNGFLRLEVIRGKKDTVKKEIAGKGLTKNKIDEDTNRSYFIQNGFEYWPFLGEYWLDEIGNYHYVGVQACE
ncbi:MAG: hypothetical protein NDI61_06590 [Bdellovibrionaceae bacterium]|nr:hypothetical protein [Pseudobdellovibrionaceae bacterium]